MQTDLDMLSIPTIKDIVRAHMWDEEQLLGLIRKEREGRNRQGLVAFLVSQAAKSRRMHNLKQAEVVGNRLTMVCYCTGEHETVILRWTTANRKAVFFPVTQSF